MLDAVATRARPWSFATLYGFYLPPKERHGGRHLRAARFCSLPTAAAFLDPALEGATAWELDLPSYTQMKRTSNPGVRMPTLSPEAVSKASHLSGALNEPVSPSRPPPSDEHQEWDSLAHIDLIEMVESRLRFASPLPSSRT